MRKIIENYIAHMLSGPADLLSRHFVPILLCFFLFGMAVIVTFVVHGHHKVEVEEQINFPAYPEKIRSAAPRKFDEPRIGMTLDEFDLTCPTDRDKSHWDSFRSYTHSGGTRIDIRREYTDARRENHCYGSFTFDNDDLTSIYR